MISNTQPSTTHQKDPYTLLKQNYNSLSDLRDRQKFMLKVTLMVIENLSRKIPFHNELNFIMMKIKYNFDDMPVHTFSNRLQYISKILKEKMPKEKSYVKDIEEYKKKLESEIYKQIEGQVQSYKKLVEDNQEEEEKQSHRFDMYKHIRQQSSKIKKPEKQNFYSEQVFQKYHKKSPKEGFMKEFQKKEKSRQSPFIGSKTYEKSNKTDKRQTPIRNAEMFKQQSNIDQSFL